MTTTALEELNVIRIELLEERHYVTLLHYLQEIMAGYYRIPLLPVAIPTVASNLTVCHWPDKHHRVPRPLGLC